MIKVLDRAGFNKTLKFAKGLGGKSWESLRDSISLLSLFGHAGTRPRKTLVVLGRDFVDHSFTFAVYRMEDDGRQFLFNGGLICHGAGSNGMGEMSITLAPKPFINWQVHT